MKSTKPIAALLAFLITVGYLSCKKTDPIPKETEPPKDRFFAVQSDAPKQVKAIAEALKKQNDTYNYLSNLTKTAGYPKWDKARIANFDNGSLTARESDEIGGEVVYIPFVRDSDNHVNSPACGKDESIRHNLQNAP